MDAIYATTAVIKLLKSSAEVTGRVGTRIYPVVALLNTLQPYIVVRRVSLQGNDGTYKLSPWSEPPTLLDVACVVDGTDYGSSVELAGAVRDCLLSYGDHAELGISDLSIDNAVEEYENELFMQIFSITIQ